MIQCVATAGIWLIVAGAMWFLRALGPQGIAEGLHNVEATAEPAATDNDLTIFDLAVGDARFSMSSADSPMMSRSCSGSFAAAFCPISRAMIWFMVSGS